MKRVWIILFIALAALALNLFVIGPSLPFQYGSLFYVVFRILALVAVPAALARYADRSRTQAIALSTFVAFIDQVGLKSFALVHETLPGVAFEPRALFYGLAMGYVASFPIILVLSFLGWEVGRVGRGPVIRPASHT